MFKQTKKLTIASLFILGILFGGFLNIPQGSERSGRTPKVQAADFNISCNGTAINEAIYTTVDNLTFQDGGSGECILDNPLSVASVIIESGAYLTHTDEYVNGITIATTGNFEIQSGGSINVDSKGCQVTTIDGKGPNGSNTCFASAAGAGGGSSSGGSGDKGVGGGSYGGLGGDGSSVNGGKTIYGSPSEPVLFGSSGGSISTAPTSYGGDGGGIVILNIAGTFTHNGIISADGGDAIWPNSNAGGGGSGGTINIITSGLAGTTGVFTVNGGNGGGESPWTHQGGGGSGGRISVRYNTDSLGLTDSNFSVDGGIGGGTATVKTATPGQKGSVYIADNNGTIGDTTDDDVTILHGFDYDNTAYNVNSWTIDSSMTNQICRAGTTTPSITAGTITLKNTLTCNPNDITSFNFTATDTLNFTNSSSLIIQGPASFSAGTGFNMGTGVSFSLTKLNTDLTFSIPAGNSQTWTDATITVPEEGEFIMNNAADITLAGTTTIYGNTDWTNLTNVDIQSGTGINANVRGCGYFPTPGNGSAPDSSNNCVGVSGYQGYGRGVNGAGGAGGGSYGGIGGAGSTHVAGLIYGESTPTVPDLFGSPGGDASVSRGGRGGGLISISTSGTFTLNGALSADGGDGASGLPGVTYAAGGGSGGGIYLAAETLSCGTGTLSADGGAGGNATGNDGGGGGGGRIAVLYGSAPSTCGYNFTNLVADASLVAGGGIADTSGGAAVGAAGTFRETPIVCGDGSVGPGEECDDNNTNNGDGCDSLCRTEVCGNGYLQFGETCDDGNTDNTDACLNSCDAASCGDSFIRAGIEECDDNNIIPGDGCDEFCNDEICGNGILQGAAGESCDDGNNTSGDGCSATCTTEGGGSSRQAVCPPISTTLGNLTTQLTQVGDDSAIGLNWNTDSSDSNELITVFRATGTTQNIDLMLGFADVSSSDTLYSDVFTNTIDYNKTYTYGIRAYNTCGNTGDPVYSAPIDLPERFQPGQTIDLTLNLKVKIKEVRENLLLERIRQVAEEDQGTSEDLQTSENREEIQIRIIEDSLSSTVHMVSPDISDLISYDQIDTNSELKEAILAVEDIDSLIRGHRETLTLEIWEPGNRVSPIHSQEFTTNIFGESTIEIDDFITGKYDFTIKLPNALRKSLNETTVNTTPFPLDFSTSTLKFGDFDNDNEVGLTDIQHLADGFEENPDFYDINEDGIFDLQDMMEVLMNWGRE